MAALLRQGARRIGASVLQGTQAALASPAVAEERRRLVPRRMTTDAHPPRARPTAEIQQMKEDLYDALSKAYNSRDEALLHNLNGHVYPRPHIKQWRWLRAGRKIRNFVEITGTAVFASIALAFFSTPDFYERVEKQMAMDKENRAKMRVVMERERQVEKA